MAVRPDEDRRVGGDSEKLLTLEEAARRLDVAPDDVEQMIQQGRLASFRLAGHLLRVRLGDVERVTARRRAGRGRPWDRVLDFFYFNDFYLVTLLILLTLLAVILTL